MAQGCECAKCRNKIQMVPMSDDSYTSSEGYILQREFGNTPNGNPICGRWVFRSPSGAWIDVDQYRFDLASRHGLVLG